MGLFLCSRPYPQTGKPGQAPQAVASPFSRPHPWPKRLLQTKRPPPGPPRGPFPLFSAAPWAVKAGKPGKPEKAPQTIASPFPSRTPGPERPGSSGSPGRPRKPPPPRSSAAPLGQKGRETRAGPASRRLPFPDHTLGRKRLLQTKRPQPGPPCEPLSLLLAIPPGREARKARKGPANRRFPLFSASSMAETPSPNETSPTRPAPRAFSFVLGHTPRPGNPGRPRKPSPPVPRLSPRPKCFLQKKRPPPGLPRGPLPLFSAAPPGREALHSRANPRACPLTPKPPAGYNT